MYLQENCDADLSQLLDWLKESGSQAGSQGCTRSITETSGEPANLCSVVQNSQNLSILEDVLKSDIVFTEGAYKNYKSIILNHVCRELHSGFALNVLDLWDFFVLQYD